MKKHSFKEPILSSFLDECGNVTKNNMWHILSFFKNEKKSASFKKSNRSMLTDLIHANFQNSMRFLFLHFYLILCTFLATSVTHF